MEKGKRGYLFEADKKKETKKERGRKRERKRKEMTERWGEGEGGCNLISIPIQQIYFGGLQKQLCVTMQF